MSDSSRLTAVTLIELAREGDSGAWRELWDLYGPLVAHWCRRSGVPEDTIADRSQEVFLSVSQRLSEFHFRPGPGSFRAWLWTITRNKLRDAFRRQRRQESAEGGSSALEALAQVPDPAMPDDEPTDADQMQALVQRALVQVEAEFEPRTWAAFQRTAIDRIATDVVAKELGLPPATVRQYRARVLRRLRSRLGDLP